MTKQDTDDTYRQVYLDAISRAGRKPWEPVEEDALRDALQDIGFKELLDNGHLGEVSGWRRVDVSQQGAESEYRWYYAEGSEPRPSEFRRFHELLTATAPDDYQPHYFRVTPAGKDPATQYGSWKTPDSRLTVDEAVAWMKEGGNVGIAGTPDDPLINIDIDDDEATTPADIPDTLRARSRSRTGWHAWYFNEDGGVPNIPTDDYGEVRTDWQYVVAPGSFVASTSEEIPTGADNPGYYTIEDEALVGTLSYDDLPEVFRDAAEEANTLEDTGTPPAANTYTPNTENSTTSAIFEIDASDLVSQTDAAERFGSIFHQSSTGANMSVSGGKLHCWRHNVAHGGLQALATLSDEVPEGCLELGAPHKNSGAGANRLKGDWKLIWAAWHEAKQRNLIPDDDPLPYRALCGLAVRDGLLESDDLIERETDGNNGSYTGFPNARAYNSALEHVQDTYGLNPGRDHVSLGDNENSDIPALLKDAWDAGGEIDSGPTSTLPLAQLEALPQAERKHAARKRGLDWPSTDTVRDQLREAIREAMRNEDETVIDAPTSSGKSYTISSERWGAFSDVTGGQRVIQLSATRDARNESTQTAAAENINAFTLLGRHDACPLAAGAYDPRECEESDRDPLTVNGEPVSEWINTQCDSKGLPYSLVHKMLEDEIDQDRTLPCCTDDQCKSIKQYDDLEDQDPSLIIATHNFAHVPSLRLNHNIIIDEEPDFDAGLGDTPMERKSRVERAVTAFLKEIDAAVQTWESFIQLSRVDASNTGTDASIERDHLISQLDETPDREWYFNNPDAHTLAPALARAIFRAEPRANGRRVGKTIHEPPRLDANADDSESWNREWVTVVLDNDNQIRTIRDVPDFSQARSVIGLDAHPSTPVWSANTVPHINTTSVLNQEERRLWRRYERGLRVVQVGDATRPLASGEYWNHDQVTTIITALRDEYGDDFQTAITTNACEDRLQEILEASGVQNVEEKTMHFGEEKSRNDFANEHIGLVEGSIDPGDDYVLDLLAELDLDAEPAYADCQHCNGTGDCDGHCEHESCHTNTTDCGVCNGTGSQRVHGRTFTGPDADTAEAILASVRENHTAQSAGRYARDPDDPESHATVYVRTDAYPSDFADIKVPGIEWVFTNMQREIVTVLRDATSSLTTRTIAETVDCSKEHVRKTLRRLESLGDVQAFDGGGENGATLYSDSGLPATGVVDLGETTNQHVLETSTWALAVRDTITAQNPPSPRMSSDESATTQMRLSAVLDSGGGGGDNRGS